MEIDYNADAIAETFAQMAEGRVTKKEFLEAQTPEEVDTLLARAFISSTAASRIMLSFSEIRDAEKRNVIKLNPRAPLKFKMMK